MWAADRMANQMTDQWSKWVDNNIQRMTTDQIYDKVVIEHVGDHNLNMQATYVEFARTQYHAAQIALQSEAVHKDPALRSRMEYAYRYWLNEIQQQNTPDWRTMAIDLAHQAEQISIVDTPTFDQWQNLRAAAELIINHMIDIED